MTGSWRGPLLVVTIALAGCFDVSGAQTAPILIDDFDGGDGLPADRHFDQWSCGRYNQPDPKKDCLCDYDFSTYRSPPYSMRLRAAIVAPDNKNEAGAQLYTQAVVPEDLSRMRKIGFSFRYEATDAPLPDTAQLYVELYCSSAQGRMYASVQKWRSSDWRSLAFSLSDLQPVWGAIDVGRTACLEQVDSIHFSVNGRGLSEGQAGSFVLYIDDVYLQ